MLTRENIEAVLEPVADASDVGEPDPGFSANRNRHLKDAVRSGGVSMKRLSHMTREDTMTDRIQLIRAEMVSTASICEHRRPITIAGAA